MFQHCCDHMIARLKQTFQCNIKTFCRICSKCNSCRTFCIEKICKLFPYCIDTSRSIQCSFCSASPCITHMLESIENRLFYFFRFLQCSCRIIHVDHRASLPFCMCLYRLLFRYKSLVIVYFSFLFPSNRNP